MAHFLVGCGRFERDWLVDDVCRIVGLDSGQGRNGGIAVGKRGGGHILQSDGGCQRVCIVLVGSMVAEKESIVVRVGCCWILVLLT